MTGQNKPRQGVKSGRNQFVRANATEITQLPRPGNEWTVSDRVSQLPTADVDEVSEFYHKNAVIRTGWACTDDHGGRVRTYQTDPDVYDVAKDIISTRDSPIPGCVHSGLRNARDLPEGVYTCCKDDCHNTAERSEIND